MQVDISDGRVVNKGKADGFGVIGEMYTIRQFLICESGDFPVGES